MCVPMPLWIFGFANQDITTVVDLDRIKPKGTCPKSEIVGVNDYPWIRENTRLTARFGNEAFWVDLQIRDELDDNGAKIQIPMSETDNGYVRLRLAGGGKYNLNARIHSSTEPASQDATAAIDASHFARLDLHCDHVSWGGGGVNMVTTLRSLVSNGKLLPLKYSDVALEDKFLELAVSIGAVANEMITAYFERLVQSQSTAVTSAHASSSISDRDQVHDANDSEIDECGSLHDVENLDMDGESFGFVRRHAFDTLLQTFGDEPVHKFCMTLARDCPDLAEKTLDDLARLAATYSPQRSLEVFLASLDVDMAMYTPDKPQFRRNWVIRQFGNNRKLINDKIILRGQYETLTAPTEDHVLVALKPHLAQGFTCLVLNSLKDEVLVKAACKAFNDRCDEFPKDVQYENVVAVVAMTRGMQRYAETLEKELARKPLILVFNADELVSFAKTLAGDKLTLELQAELEPFAKRDEPPNVYAFAKILKVIKENWGKGTLPRLYITLGSDGSLGYDEMDNKILYVAAYASKTPVIDTNGCGDAYCAAVALMEWAVRSGYTDIANGDSKAKTSEQMLHFMAFATAASYARATNRRGQIDRSEVIEFYAEHYLGRTEIGTLEAVVNQAWVNVQGVDANWNLLRPKEGVTHTLPNSLEQLLGALANGEVP
jgi:hypothetical protein